MAATNINRAIISGNLTHDPDLRNTSSGHTVCELRVANNVPFKDKDGNWGSKANFFQVNAWGGLGENCAKFLSKGSAVMIDGRLEWQMWEKEGKTNSRVVIVADNVQFASKKSDAEKKETEAAEAAEAKPSEDDIPF
jgi:single-strand DNA-binding protein